MRRDRNCPKVRLDRDRLAGGASLSSRFLQVARMIVRRKISAKHRDAAKIIFEGARRYRLAELRAERFVL